MNSFLIASAVYLFLTLAGLLTPYREIIAFVSWGVEVFGNYQDAKMRKIKSIVMQR